MLAGKTCRYSCLVFLLGLRKEVACSISCHAQLSRHLRQCTTSDIKPVRILWSLPAGFQGYAYVASKTCPG
ncbi:hypothetical protein K440DRAFT_627243 [Wilcoxina mikolae CBS 423.85]|nr:hypothetical protein K440DRAFT_627243 [Wilcoxina mikolae CBS 423.85]